MQARFSLGFGVFKGRFFLWRRDVLCVCCVCVVLEVALALRLLHDLACVRCAGIWNFGDGVLGWCDTYNCTAYKDSWLKMRRVGFEFGL